MKVKELIEILEKYDGDMQVYGSVYNDNDEFILEIDEVEGGVDSIYLVMEDI